MVKYCETPSSMFHALGDKTRLSMVSQLGRRGGLSVSQIAKPFHLSLPGTMKHLEVLQSAGLISCMKRGRNRTCSLNIKNIQSLAEWLLTQEHLWVTSFVRLEKIIKK